MSPNPRVRKPESRASRKTAPSSGFRRAMLSQTPESSPPASIPQSSPPAGDRANKPPHSPATASTQAPHPRPASTPPSDTHQPSPPTTNPPYTPLQTRLPPLPPAPHGAPPLPPSAQRRLHTVQTPTPATQLMRRSRFCHHIRMIVASEMAANGRSREGMYEDLVRCLRGLGVWGGGSGSRVSEGEEIAVASGGGRGEDSGGGGEGEGEGEGEEDEVVVDGGTVFVEGGDL
ncbi:hypothetical protein EJ03DRAFT_355379 [Teratosphaeria nubilosa]|uniref:Uncharacterized protein n=1 Tax=Teratosphaeria nubilosa TaxID=161662 RepID=A0A6G1KWY2_9PEZI|nr:hypothetical protein EJ03DRAFT_355379 [Teratosphaeria nubilosa]